MRLLAIETAAEACSAALYLDGEVFERFEVAPRRHSELVLPMMDSLLAEAGLGVVQLDALAFGRGPGSFTGVRIATGVIQGVAFAADLPVVPVSTLAALAQGCFRETAQRRVLAAFDARMQEIYWGAYQRDGSGVMRPLGEEQVGPPDAMAVPDDDSWFGVGSGWSGYSERLAPLMAGLAGVDSERVCHARDVALLGAAGLEEGRAVPAEQALPVYLRNKVAWKKGERPGAG